MSALVDCLACGCLIRAAELSCPFCDTSQRHAPAPVSRLSLGLTLGLGLTMFGCTDKGGSESESTVNDTTDYDADAVTYAGPDSWTDTGPYDPSVGTSVGTTVGTTELGTTTYDDSQEADAVTYAGPDESTTIGDASTTDFGTTGSSTAASDTQEADAVTYAGPDETDSIGTTG